MPNYIELVGEYYPGVQVTTVGDPSVYANLSWVSTVIPQADLDVAYLVAYKTGKILEFSEIARDEVVNGFMSDALGFPHYYDSEPEDQLNLIGAATAGVTMPYSCRAYTVGTQEVDLGGAITGTDNTGLANDTTQYNLEIQIDGTPSYLSIQGQNAQTYDDFVTVVNADADFSALGTIEITNGNLLVKSLQYGSLSTVNIVVGSLLTSLVDYVGTNASVDGVDGINGTKAYEVHTNAQLQQVLNDGAVVKLTVLQKFNTKKEQITLAADIAAVDAIAWD